MKKVVREFKNIIRLYFSLQLIKFGLNISPNDEYGALIEKHIGALIDDLDKAITD